LASKSAVESEGEGLYRPQPEATHCLSPRSSPESGRQIVRTALDKGAGLASFIKAAMTRFLKNLKNLKLFLILEIINLILFF